MIKEYLEFANPVIQGGILYDYSALESRDEFKELTKEATVIFAVDTATKKYSVIYGKELIQAIASKVIPPQNASAVCFAIAPNTTALDHLCGTVEVTKGFHEYGK